jgi:hypothetical protein
VAGEEVGDVELERQRAATEEEFRTGWVPVDHGRPTVLSQGYYKSALRAIAGGPSASLDPAIIRAVRDGAQPGDPLPPPELPLADYKYALHVISDGLLTGMDPAIIRAVRDGALPGIPCRHPNGSPSSPAFQAMPK